MLQMLLVVVVGIGIILLWVSLYDTHHFKVGKRTFSSPKIREKTRFVMLSDLHGQQYGRENQILLETIKEQKPDGILIAGDMITAEKTAKIEPVIGFLKELLTICPVYYANGNHEQKMALFTKRYGDVGARYQKALEEIGVLPLVNEKVTLQERGITIYGSEIAHHYYQRFQIPEMEPTYLEQVLGKKEEGTYGILLAHNPDFFPAYANWGAELIFAGHIHGGIMRLPFLGGVIAPSMRLFPTYDSGDFIQGTSTMVLSRGIGTHHPSVRFFNPGELVVVDLLPEEA